MILYLPYLFNFTVRKREQIGGHVQVMCWTSLVSLIRDITEGGQGVRVVCRMVGQIGPMQINGLNSQKNLCR